MASELKPVLVKANITYDDRDRKETIRQGTEFRIGYDRAKVLCGATFNNQPYVDLLSVKRQSKIKRHGSRIIIFQDYLYKIGGIETFLLNFCKHYQDRYITIVIQNGDPNILLQLGQYVDIVKDTGQMFSCDVCILGNYNSQHVLPRMKSKKVYQMIHGDFEALKKIMAFDFNKHERVDEIISVSQSAHDGLLNTFGYESKIIYNILDYDFNREKTVKFITLSRATAEKGIFRIIKMAKEFEKAGKNFVWFLCSTVEEQEKSSIIAELKKIPEIVFIPPSQNNRNLIAGCDYLVQLSDTESFCYSAYEALQRGVPCILTDYPEAMRTVEDGRNGYIIKRDLSNLDVEKIFNEIPKVESFVDRCDLSEW